MSHQIDIDGLLSRLQAERDAALERVKEVEFDRDEIDKHDKHLWGELSKLKECLEPGKANAICAGMFREVDRLGCGSPASAKHALTRLVEEIEKSRAALTTAQKERDEATAVCAAMTDFIVKSKCGRKCCDGHFYMEFSSDIRSTSTQRLRCEICEAKRQALSATIGTDFLARYKALEGEVAQYKAAMERERKEDWEKYVRDHADFASMLSTSGFLFSDDQRNALKSCSILLNEHWQYFTHKANFVPTNLRIKALEEALKLTDDLIGVVAEYGICDCHLDEICITCQCEKQKKYNKPLLQPKDEL